MLHGTGIARNFPATLKAPVEANVNPTSTGNSL